MNKLLIKAKCGELNLRKKMALKKEGSQTLDWLIIAVIVVVVGIILYGAMKTAMPGLFDKIILKIEDLLGIVAPTSP